MNEELPEDEFSELARERKMQGVHRKRRSPWLTALPILLVLIVAPALGWLTVELASQDVLPLPSASSSKDAEPTEDPTTIATEEPSAEPSEDPSADPSAEPSGEPSEEPSSEPSEEPSEDPEEAGISYDAQITVLNGSGIPGHAAETAGQLEAAGYTNVETGNYSSTIPETSAIYFAGPELYDTAQNLAGTLLIDLWAENPGAVGTSDIVIVLR